MPIYALCDMNSFYVSAELLFRPDLIDKPCIVLSNNDGCAVARSAPAKVLGIKMGAPRFEIEEIIHEHGIITFSSNYTLYADISNRVMTTLERLAPSVFIYSIDEAFLDLSGMENLGPLDTFGRSVVDTVKREVGIPCCLGISTTKTLAKLANQGAKKYPKTGGVVDLTDPKRQRRLMAITDVGDVWGVGRRIGKRLNELGISTALDLADANPVWIRKHFSVVLERTVRELNGIACIPFDDNPPHKKQIVVSRSFGERITQLSDMRQAISSYMTKAAEKLRNEGMNAGVVTVFFRTNVFNQNQPQYSNSVSRTLTQPSSDTRELIRIANDLLIGIWKNGYAFMKAGVMLSDFYERSITQQGLFDVQPVDKRSTQLMATLDKINRQKKGQVTFARDGISQSWQMKRENLSPCYTTRWSDLPKAR